MAEDEKEMLEEARARLANTRGKKAKRKVGEICLGRPCPVYCMAWQQQFLLLYESNVKAIDTNMFFRAQQIGGGSHLPCAPASTESSQLGKLGVFCGLFGTG